MKPRLDDLLMGLLALGALLGARPADAEDQLEVRPDLVSGPAYQHELLRNQWFSIESTLRLRKIDEQALGEANRWRQGDTAPAPVSGREGRVVFRFGATVPKVMCAPLRVCDIELQAGEQVQGEPHTGDDERWDITPAISGITQHVVVKPLAPNAATNMAIYTDRRVYHVELQSATTSEADYMPFVSFSYPDDQRLKWMALVQQQQTVSSQPTDTQTTGGSDFRGLSVDASRLNYRYDIEAEGWFGRKQRAKRWAPRKVFDDGRRTFIQLPEYVRHRELPMLVVRDGAGTDTIVNTSFEPEPLILVVDRLFDAGVLVLGAGRNQERVTIHREE